MPVTVEPNRSFASATGAAPAAGEWWIVVQCFSLTEGKHVDEFVTPITVAGDRWAVKQTATTLGITPASPVRRGTLIKLTATVTPALAAGSVEFRRGTTVIGSAAVEDGVATLRALAWTVETHEVTATFTPADTAAFNASTSAAVPYTVTRR